MRLTILHFGFITKSNLNFLFFFMQMKLIFKKSEKKTINVIIIWRPSSLSKLTPYWISLGLTHLGSEASICLWKNSSKFNDIWLSVQFNTIYCWWNSEAFIKLFTKILPKWFSIVYRQMVAHFFLIYIFYISLFSSKS